MSGEGRDWQERAQYAIGGYGSPADGSDEGREREALRASIVEAIADEDCRDAVAWKMGWEAAMYTFTAADPAPAGASGDRDAPWGYWRKQLDARDVDLNLAWRDADVMVVVRELVTAHEAAIRAAPATPLEPLDVDALMDAEHRWCVEVEGEWALGHSVEAHRKQAAFIVVVLRPTDTEPSGS